MQRALAEINAAQSARGLPRFEMGIGINTGEAVVGNIGSEQRAKYGVVGSAVNVAARVEGASVGGQVLVSDATWACIRDVAEAPSPPIRVAVKGLSEPLVLHRLEALTGRWPGSLPPAEDGDGPGDGVAVDLAGACWLIEGKTVSEEALPVRVVRVGRHRVDLRLAEVLAPLANVRLRVHYPDGAGESRDLYAKVISVEAEDGAHLARVHLTSVDETDRRAIESLIGSG